VAEVVVLRATLRICRSVPWEDMLVLCRSRGTETDLLRFCEVPLGSGSCKCIETRAAAAMLLGHSVHSAHSAANEQPPATGS
jgi:hypothetical protein